jgi:hypothetical protein
MNTASSAAKLGTTLLLAVFVTFASAIALGQTTHKRKQVLSPREATEISWETTFAWVVTTIKTAALRTPSWAR